MEKLRKKQTCTETGEKDLHLHKLPENQKRKHGEKQATPK